MHHALSGNKILGELKKVGCRGGDSVMIDFPTMIIALTA